MLPGFSLSQFSSSDANGASSPRRIFPENRKKVLEVVYFDQQLHTQLKIV